MAPSSKTVIVYRLLSPILEMLELSTMSTAGYMFISVLLELWMLSTKKVGDRFFTLSLEMFSLYKDIIATHVMEDLLVMLTLMVVSASVMEDTNLFLPQIQMLGLGTF